MMNNPPERIWAWPWNGEARRGQWSISGDLTGEQEYIRADHAQAEKDAAVAAEREACAKKVENTAAWKFYSYAERDRVAKSVRARANTDALAARDARVRAEALREAAATCRDLAPHISHDSTQCDVMHEAILERAARHILALIPDTEGEA